MNEELTAFIIKEISKHRDRIDLIQKVCERGGLNWKQAEQLIILTEAKYKRAIVIPPTPWLLFLSIGILILGIGLLGFNLHILLTFFQKEVFAQILNLQSGSYRFVGVFTGFGMTVGGLIGLWKAFGLIFPE
jgi:hypothetical protein